MVRTWDSGNLTLISLRGDKVLDEGVRRLRVERESVLQRLEVLRLVDVAHLESDAAGVEVLLDGLQGRLQYGALLWAQAPALRGRVDFVLEEREGRTRRRAIMLFNCRETLEPLIT